MLAIKDFEAKSIDQTKAYLEPNIARQIVNDRPLLSKLMKPLTQSPYRIKEEQTEDHKFGSGGFRQTVWQLLRNNEVLLVSIHYVSWETTSDDSMDFDSTRLQQTFLLQEDSVARRLFTTISTIKTPPKKS